MSIISTLCYLILLLQLLFIDYDNCRYSSLSYDSCKSDHTLNGSTISTLFHEQVVKHPDRDMVIFTRDNVRLTYQQAKEKVL